MSEFPCPIKPCGQPNCGHWKDTGDDGRGHVEKPKIERELTPAELAEIHDRGE